MTEPHPSTSDGGFRQGAHRNPRGRLRPISTLAGVIEATAPWP
ncbi:hypothetical protein [Synechococcus sp. CS-1332]|nr:hypothetical protein [Synechococcus sp. CS-1332]